MTQGEQGEKQRAEPKGQRPGLRDIAELLLQKTGTDDNHALSENRGDAVEGAADADKGALVAFVQGEHIEAVSGDVVGCRSEGHDVKEYQAQGESSRACGKGEGSEAQGDESLHREYPPALGAYDVHKGTPKWLDYPGKVQKGRK